MSKDAFECKAFIETYKHDLSQVDQYVDCLRSLGLLENHHNDVILAISFAMILLSGLLVILYPDIRDK